MERKTIFLGLGAVALILLIVWASYGFPSPFSSPPVPGVNGGVLPAKSPAAGVPATPATTSTVVTSPPMVSKNVKFIELKKIYNNGFTDSFQVSEIMVYVNTNGVARTLSADDYSSAVIEPGGNAANMFPASYAIDGNPNNFAHTMYATEETPARMLFTLKNEQLVTKVVVFNRTDCCQERLSDVVLTLYNDTMRPLKACVLDSNLEFTCVL